VESEAPEASPAPLVVSAAVSAPVATALFAADDLGENHPLDVYVNRLRTDVSRRTTERKLDMVARVMAERWPAGARLGDPRGERYGVAWLALTPVACEQLRSAMADRWSPATANAALAAVRGVLRAAWLAGAFDSDYRDRLFAGLTAVRGDDDYVKPRLSPSPTLSDLLADDDDPSGEAPGRHLEPGEIRALWTAATGDRKAARGARNAAAVALLYGCGLRAGEAVALDLADLELGADSTARVFGKGRKRRRVPVPAPAVPALERWIVVRGRAGGPLLLPVLKNGDVRHARGTRPARLTPQALTAICLTLARQAGIAPFRAHDLRRTFAGQHLDAGTDISTVAALMGHASVTTTSRYDRRPDRARREAQGRLFWP